MGGESGLPRVSQLHDRFINHRRNPRDSLFPWVKTCGSSPLRLKPFPGPCSNRPIDFSNKISIPPKKRCFCLPAKLEGRWDRTCLAYFNTCQALRDGMVIPENWGSCENGCRFGIIFNQFVKKWDIFTTPPVYIHKYIYIYICDLYIHICEHISFFGNA